MRHDVATFKKRLDELEALVRKANDEAKPGDEAVARLSEYLVIRVSGFIEVSMHEILSDYADRATKKQEVAAFVDARLNKDYNLNEEKICQIIGSFSKEWSQQAKRSLSGRPKESIDSVVNLRNTLAHGDQVGVTLKTATDYYHDVLEAMRVVADICNPDARQWFA